MDAVRAEYTRREVFPSRFGEALHQALARVVSGDDAAKALVQALALRLKTFVVLGWLTDLNLAIALQCRIFSATNIRV